MYIVLKENRAWRWWMAKNRPWPPWEWASPLARFLIDGGPRSSDVVGANKRPAENLHHAFDQLLREPGFRRALLALSRSWSVGCGAFKDMRIPSTLFGRPTPRVGHPPGAQR
jgi:hypothetical protein